MELRPELLTTVRREKRAIREDVKSLSTRGPGRHDTWYLTHFSQTFTDDSGH